MERTEFLPVGGDSIFSILHEPASDSPRGGVLFLHPFAEEKLWVGRASTNLARHLAAAGLAVMRFDFRGAGDSDLSHGEMRLAGMREDAHVAAAALRRLCAIDSLHLFGFRLGGTLALEFASELGADSVALVNPLPAGGVFLQKALRSNLTTQMSLYGEVRQDRETLLADMRERGAVNIDGYAVAAELWDEISALDLTASESVFPGPVLVLSLTRREGTEADAASRAVFERVGGNPASRLLALPYPPIWSEQKRFAVGDETLFAPLAEWLCGQWREVAV